MCARDERGRPVLSERHSAIAAKEIGISPSSFDELSDTLIERLGTSITRTGGVSDVLKNDVLSALTAN